jgi:hypothetical protein
MAAQKYSMTHPLTLADCRPTLGRSDTNLQAKIAQEHTQTSPSSPCLIAASRGASEEQYAMGSRHTYS